MKEAAFMGRFSFVRTTKKALSFQRLFHSCTTDALVGHL
jgi:hypothetical protein